MAESSPPASRGTVSGSTCVNKRKGKHSILLLTGVDVNQLDLQHHTVGKVEATYAGSATKILWKADPKLHAHGASKKYAKIFLQGEANAPPLNVRGDDPPTGTLTITLVSDGTGPAAPIVDDVPVLFVDEPGGPC